jgi:AraC-like DNA-binding protein
MRDSLDRVADAVARTSTVRSRVRRTIERLLLETREASAVSVARTLHMSRRTLSRKLEQEGTSFAGELDDVRRDLACGYIEGSKRSLAEIAFLLGFSHVESFHRAFRRWTGTTPSAYRTQQVAGP